jgi:hypothetical protein
MARKSTAKAIGNRRKQHLAPQQMDVRSPDSGRARLARPAEGCARSVGRLDDTADPGACANNRDADNEVGGRP